MVKKVIAFDLDDTLAISKSPITDKIGELLCKLLDKYDVCIISGGAFKQFKIQVIDRMKATQIELEKLHIMPTSGTRYYSYDKSDNEWHKLYSYDLTEEQRRRTIQTLEEGAKSLGLWEEKTYGDIIEDRGSQITFSALGQEAPPDLKHTWDPDAVKRNKLREYVTPLLSDLEVRAGGSTSVDITLPGIDKGFGMKKLAEVMNISLDEILFIGDRLEEGGNDYPVKAMGIDCINVTSIDETALVIETILSVS